MSLNFSFPTYNLLRDYCLMSEVSILISTVTSAMRIILLLPLCTFILYLGHQQWRQQRCFKTASHSDLFTYHLAAMELIWVFGCLLTLGGSHAHGSVIIIIVGSFICCMTLFGEIFFHILTCGERYLAVVHPITYRGLRNTRGIRIRNISIGCVWLLSFILTSLYNFAAVNYSAIALFCTFTLSIIFLSFCSVSVLCVLIGSGPGEGGGEKKRVDQSKRRAFQSITAISCVAWLWFAGLLVSGVMDQLALGDKDACVIMMCLVGLNLPSCLVQPLLYLHKAGKLPCSRGK